MFTRPGYHTNWNWTRNRENEIRWAARTIASALGAENPRGERSQRRQSCQPRGWMPRNGPRRFYGPPRRFQERPEPWTSRPYSYGEQRRTGSWQQGAQRPYPQDRKPQVRPRRGPPVVAIREPRWHQHDEWETRQPRGSNPRGTLRGGPERPADDPRRNPRGGLCGGPGRSAKEPQTPSQTNHGKTNGGNAGKPKGKDERRPTIITVEENGH